MRRLLLCARALTAAVVAQDVVAIETRTREHEMLAVELAGAPRPQAADPDLIHDLRKQLRTLSRLITRSRLAHQVLRNVAGYATPPLMTE